MNGQVSSRRRFLREFGLASAGLVAGASSISAGSPPDLRQRLFCLETWFYKTELTLREQSKMLHDLGCPRMTYCPGGDVEKWKTFPDALKQIDQGGSDLTATYVVFDIDNPDALKGVETVISALEGRDTLVWVAFTSTTYKPSDESGDKKAIPLLQEIADLADGADLDVSIYHHFNFWGERIADAFRLAEKSERENVGCTFNLYHWLKVEGPENLRKRIELTLPRLNCVTINGSHPNAKEMTVEEGILPLGKGSYDVESFVAAFVNAGYTGPFGLQGYGIEGDIRTKLQHTLREWETYCAHIQQNR